MFRKPTFLLSVLGGPLGALVLIGAIATEVVPTHQAYSVALFGVYSILVMSVGLLGGWGGVWSVGHPGLFAIGAYVAAYGSGHGWPLEVVVLVAVALTAACGGFLGFAGARFSILYIALLTLAFTLVTLEIINRWSDVTGGDEGIPVDDLRSVLLGTSFSPSSSEAEYLTLITAGLVVTVAVLVKRSALRMRLVAAKSHPIAARSVGIAPESQTSLGFAVSGAFAGLSGVLLALTTGFISSESFSLVLAISIIAAAVLGGGGSIVGALVGGAYLTWVPNLSDSVGVDQPIVQGVVLILALLFLPGGVVPFAGKLLRALWSRIRPTAADHAEQLPTAPADADLPDPDVAPGTGVGSTLLEVEHLSVRYGGLKALEDATLEVSTGEVVAIIGPNGAGKTTMVNTLSGLVGGGKVDGRVELLGRSILGGRATRRRSLGIGRTFQHAETFTELTVLENVLCTHRRITPQRRSEAIALLTDMGLGGVLHRKPSELAFGLQKQLDFARAIAEQPQLLVLDEPFGGLDAAERAVAARHLRRVAGGGAGVLIVDHVLDDLFAVADRVVAFDFGRTIGSGTPDTVLDDPQVRASYLGSAGGHAAPPPLPGDPAPVIRLEDVGHRFGGVVALRDIDLTVPAGAVIGVVGANGAGKSTLGRILHGELTATSGSRTTPSGATRISLVPEGRHLFKTLSLQENLEVAAYAVGIRGTELKERLASTAAWLPERLRTRMDLPAAALSGGEQQILAIARGLMAQPDVLILDEPALGLAPAWVDDVYGRITDLAADGMTIVLLEQLLSRALAASHRVVVLTDGRITARGDAGQEGFAERAEAAYFGGRPEELLTEAQELADPGTGR
ncbi:ATP-binding cassette domain-containing protein [Nakamurella sp. YIM 132087]|uniref:ATP-binding cassette domain-containing protein n=1 Tax=Nakamurella alba TaxID=2665158 RepID=A0A7K1FVN4_9ACTN|nr:ATP-binding cassette domain-containing protein [Nakamurella alba]